MILIHEFLEEGGISGRIFGGQDGSFGGEAVTQSVERGTLFPFAGARTGGMQAVGTVDGRTVDGCGGLDSYLQVLDAERNLFGGQLVLAQLRLMELDSVVQLYRALGGGWQ